MKKKLFTLGLITILICMFLTGCNESNDNNNLFPHLDYSNSEYGFGINVPEGWTIDDSGLMGSIVIFYGSVEYNFTINIVITSDQLAAGNSLDDTIDELMKYYEDFFTKFQLISSNSTIINNMSAHEIVYTYDQGSFSLNQNQIIVQKNSKLIILTYSTTILSYDTYHSDFQQSVNSLEIA